MDYSPNYQTTVVSSLQNLYDRVISYLPNLFVAVVVLLVGWLIGSFLSKLVKKVLEAIKIDTAANQLGLQALSERMGRRLSFAAFGGWVIKWFFFLGSFIAAANILGLNEVTTFLSQTVLTYAGQVIIAMAILFLGILAANFFSEIVGASVKASGVGSGPTLAALTKWLIVTFAVMAALSQLQIAPSFLSDLFRAVVAMLAIAGGLAFGLGGKEHAKKILDSIEHNVSKRA